MRVQTPKGFRDFLPGQANAREFVVGKIKETFKLFGFEPLETPALEFAQTLKGKYGEEEKLIYEFKTKGGDEVALRYDQTVPLARVVAQYPDLPKPFKRYQIQTVWRGENPQKGRFREFLQCDADIVGSSSPLADAEIIVCILEVMKQLGFEEYTMFVNDRKIFEQLQINQEFIRILDKMDKIGEQGVLNLLNEAMKTGDKAQLMFKSLKNSKPTQELEEIIKIVRSNEEFKNKILFYPWLARGLDYYTSTIFELRIGGFGKLSVGGGGRYDKLIGQYSGNDNPAVGFSFGFDRLIEAMEQFQLLPTTTSSAKVLVTVFSPDLLEKSIEVTLRLRSENINTELWLDPEAKLDKQLKYADQKGIPFCIILGPDEAKTEKVTLKNLTTQKQETISLEDAIASLQHDK